MPTYRLYATGLTDESQEGHWNGNPGAVATPPISFTSEDPDEFGFVPALFMQGVGNFDSAPPGKDIWSLTLDPFTVPAGETAVSATLTMRFERWTHPGHVAYYDAADPSYVDDRGYHLKHITYAEYEAAVAADAIDDWTVYIQYRAWDDPGSVQQEVSLQVNGGVFSGVATDTLDYYSKTFVFDSPETMAAGQTLTLRCDSELGSNLLRPAWVIKYDEIWVDVVTSVDGGGETAIQRRVAPPLRQWPRTDGLGMSSANRVWPPSRSAQASNRRIGGYW